MRGIGLGMKRRWMWVSLVAAAATFAGCAEESGPVPGPGVDEFGVEIGAVDEEGKRSLSSSDFEEPPGKADALVGRTGLPVSADNSSLTVWSIKNQWEDTDTAAAREAGMAWGQDSGLTWEEKYRRWVGSLEKIDAESFGQTFMLTTPFGREVPAPALECAEVAMFLRITFASWYNLPFYMEARDRSGNRLYFGHFGIRTAAGNFGRMPQFRSVYKDFSDQAEAVRKGEVAWPSDEKLAARKIVGSFDDAQPMIGPDAHAGAYFDQIFLNKRVGYYMMLHLTYFGSINLADPAHTFNIQAGSIKPGDTLLERWQSQGIGHTLVVLRTTDLGVKDFDGVELPQLEVELGSGSMPRRQPRWDSPAASKRYLVDETTGGIGYEALNGGIKRFRIAKSVGGVYANVVPKASEGDYINSKATDLIGARPGLFEKILAELAPEEKLQALLDIVESKRQHLRQLPASCSARIGREDAFDEIYKLGQEVFGWDRDEVDRRFRNVEDYVLARLVYEKSKTCCWNSTTPEMYNIIMEHAATEIEDPATGECREISVFMARDDAGDGFELFADFADAIGRADQWPAWRADETCPQATTTAQDTEAEHAWAPLCSVHDAISARN